MVFDMTGAPPEGQQAALADACPVVAGVPAGDSEASFAYYTQSYKVCVRIAGLASAACSGAGGGGREGRRAQKCRVI